MKKNTIKAFTLVEMLIVIVIIGILIASLMPRMQSAQWRARDVARKNDLAQIQTAIITSQQDKWVWPGLSQWATWGISVETIANDLINAWMSSVPSDPNKSNENGWISSSNPSAWQYGYLVAQRNWIPNGWFVLWAKTEVEWWSNWLACSGTSLSDWYIQGHDLKEITTCDTFTLTGTCTLAWGGTTWNCYYKETGQLRYILLY